MRLNASTMAEGANYGLKRSSHRKSESRIDGRRTDKTKMFCSSSGGQSLSHCANKVHVGTFLDLDLR